jgi:signal transduction histidine kinase
MWGVLSLPVYLKILGAGAFIMFLFGIIILLETRNGLSRTLDALLEERALSTAQALAADLERPMVTGEHLAVEEKLDGARATVRNLRYVIARDHRGRVVAHTFAENVPADLLGVLPDSPTQQAFQVLGTDDGALAFCTAVGAGLAFLLTRALIWPIGDLTRAANRIREEDFSSRAEVFSGDEIGSLALVFNQMAEKLQRSQRDAHQRDKARRSLIEKTVRAQEEERKNISRELHDQLGHSLLMLLLTIQSRCRYSGLEGNVCREMEHKVKSLIDEVHRLASGMRPSILDDYGLDSALSRYVGELQQYNEVDIDYQYVDSSDLGRLPSEVEVTLFRIAQEAITNILRHASASHTSVVLLRGAQEVTLLVEDDGCGFDPAALEDEGHTCLGLTGMRERASLLGGACRIESFSGKGSTVRVIIPVTGGEHADSSDGRR